MKIKATPGFINNPAEWKEPTPIATINIDPSHYSHLLIYKDYCQVVVRQVTSPALNKSDAETVLEELKGVLNSFGTTRSKLSAIKYTPTSIKIGQCTLLGKSGHDGLIEALELYVTDGPYPKDTYYENSNQGGAEIIAKEVTPAGKVFTWWDMKKHSFGGSFQLIIIGPYETFHLSFQDKKFITQLRNAVVRLRDTDAIEIKLDMPAHWPGVSNLRVFKQMLNDEPAICISTDEIMGNQRSLICISKKSTNNFIKFLGKAHSLLS